MGTLPHYFIGIPYLIPGNCLAILFQKKDGAELAPSFSRNSCLFYVGAQFILFVGVAQALQGLRLQLAGAFTGDSHPAPYLV